MKFKQITKFYFRSNETINRKKAEAHAERELAVRKREDARRAKDEVHLKTWECRTEGVGLRVNYEGKFLLNENVLFLSGDFLF